MTADERECFADQSETGKEILDNVRQHYKMVFPNKYCWQAVRSAIRTSLRGIKRSKKNQQRKDNLEA